MPTNHRIHAILAMAAALYPVYYIHAFTHGLIDFQSFFSLDVISLTILGVDAGAAVFWVYCYVSMRFIARGEANSVASATVLDLPEENLQTQRLPGYIRGIGWTVLLLGLLLVAWLSFWLFVILSDDPIEWEAIKLLLLYVPAGLGIWYISRTINKRYELPA